MIWASVSAAWAHETGELENEILSLSEIVEYGLENNPDIEDAEYSLRSAADNLTGTFKLENSSLTGSTSWISASAANQDSLTSRISLNVPVTDQISLSGSWDLENSGTASVSLSPLNLTSSAKESRASLLKAGIRLNYLSSEVETNVIIAALDYLTTEREYGLSVKEATLAEKEYEAGYALYSRDEITYDDLQDLNDELITAQSSEIDSRIARTEAETEFFLLTGPDAGFLPEEITREELETMIIRQQEAIRDKSGSSGSTESLETAAADYEISLAKFDTRLVFQPDLTVTSGVSFSAGENPVVSAGFSMGISPETFDQNERNLLAQAVDNSLRNVRIEEFKLEISLQTAMDGISTAEKAVALAETDLNRKQTVHAETILLYKQGERTSLEAEDAGLGLARGELNLFKAEINLFRAQRELLAYFI